MNDNQIQLLTNEIVTLYGKINALSKKSIPLILTTGEKLSALKTELKPKKLWEKWIKTQKDILSRGTINRWIRVYQCSLDPEIRKEIDLCDTQCEVFEACGLINGSYCSDEMDQNDPSPDHDDNTNGNEETPNGDGQSTKGKTKKRNDWESQKTPYKRFRWLFTKIMDIENYTKSDFKKHELKELLRLGQPMVKWCQTVDLPVVEMEQ